MSRITAFKLMPDTLLAEKYVVEEKIGGGWEGEVYRVRERRTGIRRAVKLFFPQRNRRNATVRRYAKMLDKLRRCDAVMQYHHSETIDFDGVSVTFLVSELMEGRVLSELVAAEPAGRLHAYEALCLTHELSRAVEAIHLARAYHGDLHEDNVLVRREGIYFHPKLFDFYHRGPSKRQYRQMDVVDVVRLLYDAVGGASHYRSQPEVIKRICCGLRSDLIKKRYPTATHLRRHLESFPWND